MFVSRKAVGLKKNTYVQVRLSVYPKVGFCFHQSGSRVNNLLSFAPKQAQVLPFLISYYAAKFQKKSIAQILKYKITSFLVKNGPNAHLPRNGGLSGIDKHATLALRIPML